MRNIELNLFIRFLLRIVGLNLFMLDIELEKKVRWFSRRKLLQLLFRSTCDIVKRIFSYNSTSKQ